jgi:hypothetical protein
MSFALAMLFSLRAATIASPDAAAWSGGVQWQAPASCPTQADVEARIAARVSLELVRVQATIDATADGFAAAVAIDSAHGSSTRTLASPSCDSIVDAIVLLAHVAGEPLPTYERIAPPAPVPVPEVPEPVAADPTAVTPIATAPVAPATAVPERPEREPLRVRATIGASAIVGGGTLPRIDAGVLGALGVSTRIGRAELGALYLAPQRADLAQDARIGVDAWGIALRICPTIPLPLDRLELSICATATAGRLRGTSSGAALASSREDAQPWVRLAGGPELAIAVHPRVRLVAAVDGGGHVVAPGFAIGGAGRWAPRPWAVHGLAGVQMRLP